MKKGINPGRIIIEVLLAVAITAGNWFLTSSLADRQEKARIIEKFAPFGSYSAENNEKYIDIYRKYPEEPVMDLLIYVNSGLSENQKIEYSHQVTDLLKVEKTDMEKFGRYLDYLNKYGIDAESAVEIVNYDLDKEEIAYSPSLLSLVKDDYFLKSRVQRYVSYLESNSEKSVRDVVEAVNCNLDIDKYTLTSDLSKGILIIANKYYSLGEDYVPDDLVTIEEGYSTQKCQMRAVAFEHFKQMSDDAKKIGLKIVVNRVNAYRSYKTQESTYNYFVRALGEAKGSMRASKPGYSEHQTGLAFDIAVTNVSYSGYSSKSPYQWAIDNAYKYGFILRYPENKEELTGYTYEPWHYRYVGEDVAKFIHDTGITYDEYYACFVEDNLNH